MKICARPRKITNGNWEIKQGHFSQLTTQAKAQAKLSERGIFHSYITTQEESLTTESQQNLKNM